MIVRFTVPGRPTGKNKRHQIGRGRARIIMQTDAREFMQRVALYGLAARNSSPWPKDTLAPKRVRLSVDVWNTKHDAAACSPLVADALEWIFYQNDRIVSYGAQELPFQDGGEPRIEVAVELLACHTADELAAKKLAMQRKTVRKLKG